MKKRNWLALLWTVGIALALLTVPVSAEGETEAKEAAAETAESSPVALEADARSYVLMEQETGEVLAGENIHEQLEPASVTKVMTMLLVVEALDSGQITTEDVVTVSDYAAGMGGSQIYLEPGEQMTVNDLLKSVAVVSANDAAVALAEYLSGSESAFVADMNQRAQELGMEDTTFVNCNGLPAEGHVTSAYDIALMSRELMTHARIQEYTTIWMDSVRDGAFELSNTNKLVKTYTGCTGLKTGYTDSALYCLSATATRDDLSLIAVVMGASTSALRFSAASTLLDYGFANYTTVSIQPTEALPPIHVKLGESSTVQPVLEGEYALLVEKAQAGSVTTEVELAEELTAPVAQGDTVGELVVYLDGEECQRIPLTAGESVERLTFATLFRRIWRQMATGHGNQFP